MRLTPSWLRSSSGSSDEVQPSDDGASSEVPIHYTSLADSTQSTPVDSNPEATADDFVPESDATLLAVLEEMNTPATVDSIVDQLLESSEPPIETWAGVHERLYDDRLPDLDESGAIEFDPERGTVDVNRSSASGGAGVPVSIVAFALGGLFFVFFFAWMTSMVTALTFTFVVISLVAWFVPFSGIV